MEARAAAAAAAVNASYEGKEKLKERELLFVNVTPPSLPPSLPTSAPSYCRPGTCTLKAGEGTHFFFSRSNQARSVRPGSR